MYLYSGPSEIRTHTRTGLSRLPLPVGLPDHLPKKQGTDAILVAAIASPYLSRQVSAFRRFRQFLLPISCRLYMPAVAAGLRNFLNAITLRYSTFRVS